MHDGVQGVGGQFVGEHVILIVGEHVGVDSILMGGPLSACCKLLPLDGGFL